MLKLSEKATYQIVEEIADIIIGVDFPQEDVETYGLVSTSIFVSYDLEGNFQCTSICGKGLTVDWCLTDEELEQLFNHIDENGFKDELLKEINLRL
ncbi:hypothetical protein bcgnr5378_05120 [Bacillus cereus]|uniref:Uncharacterized protein n=1 Tax=Bacillus cereus TaxID=1396 RepID=A0A164LDR9_BACCE|nr:hypothetical protein [Bacillus cereus]KZD55706.1 hypothetical protein B4088_5451 [Bacillus cereus]